VHGTPTGRSTRWWSGEYERAFAGDQLLNLLPLFDEHGVQLCLPEPTVQ
jgi:hypothetical protein